ncbi:hypothetical protein V6N13_092206 [Hibiscus sabdariffa]
MSATSPRVDPTFGDFGGRPPKDFGSKEALVVSDSFCTPVIGVPESGTVAVCDQDGGTMDMDGANPTHVVHDAMKEISPTNVVVQPVTGRMPSPKQGSDSPLYAAMASKGRNTDSCKASSSDSRVPQPSNNVSGGADLPAVQVLVENDDVVVKPAGDVVSNNSLSRVPVAGNNPGQELSVSRPVKQTVKNLAYKESNLDRKKMDVSTTVRAVDVIPIVGSKDVEIIPHNNKQLSDDHVAISIMEPYDSSQKLVCGKMVKARKSVKEGKRGLQIRKPAGIHSLPKPTMSDWVQNLLNQLQMATQASNVDPVVAAMSSTVREDASATGAAGLGVVEPLQPGDAPSNDGLA